MSIRVEVVCIGADRIEERRELMVIERAELAMETLAMNLKESKAFLKGVQDLMVAHQVHEYLEQHRKCPQCGRRYAGKDAGSTPVNTVFGQVDVPNPRWKRCACSAAGPLTFRPTNVWLQGRTSPELLYLETKWPSLIPPPRSRIC